jgi:hypothetical protein
MEEAYLHITRYLFTGENAAKQTHKQMYWRLFGDLAVKYLESNLSSFQICHTCNMK